MSKVDHTGFYVTGFGMVDQTSVCIAGPFATMEERSVWYEANLSAIEAGGSTSLFVFGPWGLGSKWPKTVRAWAKKNNYTGPTLVLEPPPPPPDDGL